MEGLFLATREFVDASSTVFQILGVVVLGLFDVAWLAESLTPVTRMPLAMEVLERLDDSAACAFLSLQIGSLELKLHGAPPA